MRRREFITFLGGAAAAWPFVSRAQQRAMSVIGFVSSRSSGKSAVQVAAFREGLSEKGFVEGNNLAIAFRWAEGHYDRFQLYALNSFIKGLPYSLQWAGRHPRWRPRRQP